MSNALRHGAPRSVDIRVAVDGNAATLEISDDGSGFDVDWQTKVGY